jgi:hypothetical protein
MKLRLIYLTLLLAVGLTTAAWADGRIYGSITYKNCDCHIDDKVCIRPVSGGEPIYIDVICSPGGPHYQSFPTTIPPGTYYISVKLHEGSNCVNTFVQMFVHGNSNDRCDLLVTGPDGNPTRPDPGP